MKIPMACLWICLFLWAPGRAQATMSIAWTEQNGSGSLGWNGGNWVHQGQTFTLSDTWNLLSAEFLFFVNNGEPGQFIATVRDGNDLALELASVSGYTASTTHPGWESFDFGNFELGPGRYALTLSTPETFPAASATFAFDTAGGAPGGRVVYDGFGWENHGDGDDATFCFTFNAVPEPLSSGLILTGGALLLARRRKSNGRPAA